MILQKSKLYFFIVLSILFTNRANAQFKHVHPGEQLIFKGNSTIMGWEGDKDAAIVKDNGWFFIRDGVNTLATFMISSNTSAGKFKWYPHSGHLPCFVTEFEERKCLVKISNFADKVTINNRDFVIAYSRVEIENPTKEEIKITPMASSILTSLNTYPSNVIAAGQKVKYDYAVVTDRFGNNYDRPTVKEIVAAGSWDTHFDHMKAFWESKLAQIVAINSPDQELNNAYRMGFIYTLITKDGEDYHTGEFGYDVMYNHDYLGILNTLFKIGYYDNAREQIKKLGKGVGNYHDQFYRWCLPLSVYLQKTNDVEILNIDSSFVFKKCMAAYDTTMKDINPTTGILKPTWDIDDSGLWTWDNESALTGFTCYKYVAQLKGNQLAVKNAENGYNTLLKNLNKRLTDMSTTASGMDYIPASLELPNEKMPHVMKKGSSFWATPFWFGMNWDTYLAGGVYEGPLLERIDNTYKWGFSKMKNENFDAHNIGTWVEYGNGISSVYNASFCISGLLSKNYRQESIKAYQFMLENGQSAPYGFWEMFQAPDPKNTWHGKHPAEEPNWFSCPHQWGQAGATQALLDALIAEFYDGKLLIGRGYLDEWCAKGKVTELNNFPISNKGRTNIKIEFLTANEVQLTISGSKPTNKVIFNLPIFDNNIARTSVGKINNEQGTITLEPTVQKVVVTLKKALN